MGAAEDLLALTLTRPATLGEGRLIGVDGPAGAGKTTLADTVAGLFPPAHVIHLDDLYDGWDGLPRVGEQLDTLLRPLARAEPGHYRRYDWHAGAYAETVLVRPVPLLILEGVGAGLAPFGDVRTTLAWVDAPVEQRRAQALARDGDVFAPHWERWAAQEREHFAHDGTLERADLVIATPVE